MLKFIYLLKILTIIAQSDLAFLIAALVLQLVVQFERFVDQSYG